MSNSVEGIVTGLNIFPVKGLRGISLQNSEVTPLGLKWDRFWMVVNEDGLFMSQRNLPLMATIETELNDNHLVLSHPQHGETIIPLAYHLNDAEENAASAKVWKSECQVLDEGAAVSDWLTAVLGSHRGQRLRLVRQHPRFQREVSNNHTDGRQYYTHFADGYPFLVTTTESLTDLNKQLLLANEEAVPMARFRSNIVVSGVTPFVEHQFPYLELTDYARLHLCKPCERCKVTSIDQESGHSEFPREPLKTLFSMTHVPGKGAFFGHNAVLQINHQTETSGFYLAVGDRVRFS